MTVGYSDEEFVGYAFAGSPERRPRLWFLDRHISLLLSVGGWTIGHTDIDVGTWFADADEQPDKMVLPRLLLRYEHHGGEPWTAVWRLTDLTIPQDVHDAAAGFGVNTFGRDDDVWRLGVWPD